MSQKGEQAREQLALARERAAQLFDELGGVSQSEDPEWGRRVKAYRESTEKVVEAEHAVGKVEDGTPGITGKRGHYRWLSSVDHGIDDLLRLCPEVLLGKRIAVTSRDCQGLLLTEDEKVAGWWATPDRKVYKDLPSGGLEYPDDWMVSCSPILHSVHGLPNETRERCAGFDEWYVFDGEIPVSDFEVFVDWGGFRLYDAGYQEFIDRFWKQMETLNAESYIADGTVFTFATRNLTQFEAVIAKLTLDLA